jgi:hypothetical protein
MEYFKPSGQKLVSHVLLLTPHVLVRWLMYPYSKIHATKEYAHSVLDPSQRIVAF